MIAYTEKGIELHAALYEAGYRLDGSGNTEAFDLDGNQSTAIDIAVQSIIDSFDPLPHLKKAKINEIKEEGLRRIALVFPSLQSFDELQLVKELYLSIDSRTPTPTLAVAINLYQDGVAGVATVNGFTNQAQVQAFNVVTDISWSS